MKTVTLHDISLKHCYPNARVSHLKEIYFRAVPEICTERAWLITRYHLDNGLFEKDRISILDKARAYRYVLENRVPIVRHSRAYDKDMKPFSFKEAPLFAGSTTSKFKGVPVYPEFLGLALWPELWTISKRGSNPYHILKNEVEDLNYHVFPHWIEHSIDEIARKRVAFDGSSDTGIVGGEKGKFDDMTLLERLIFYLVSKPEAISHTIPDFSKAIRFGLRTVINDALQRERDAKGQQQEFYKAVVEVLEGIISYSNRLAIEAEKLAQGESDAILRHELRETAEIHKHVPEHPARTFREALTTIWICWVAIHLENPNVGLSLGRLDQVLFESYQKDIGRITIDDAMELVCGFWLKIGDHVPAIPGVAEQLFGGTGSNQAITIGGVNGKGEDAVNDLTYVMLRATELMKLRDPNLNARYSPRINSTEYLKRLCEVNFNTGATPAIHNDIEVIKALRTKGDTLEQARDYGIIGCVEPGSSGRFYGSCGAILLNLTSALELTLFNGKHRHIGLGRDSLVSFESGDPCTFTSFDQFKKAFESQVCWLIEKATRLNNRFGVTHQDFYPTPILSAFFEGPTDKGKDLIQGGAEINASGATIVGLADVADSLSAIEKVVFKEQYDFWKFLDALKCDFKGYENLHKRLINPSETPKYGNEHKAADDNVEWLVRLLDREFWKKVNYRGGNYRVGYWTMTNHAGLGRLMKALPNGRKAGENLASGITPVSGVTPCLPAVLNSVARLPSGCLSNGVALNLKFVPIDGGKEEMVDNLASYVEAYFDERRGQNGGGMEIQFNIIDRRTFLDVVRRPKSQDYNELLVRVSGYTAYFRDLSPQMKKEIIDRTEYRLSTGKMTAYDPIPLPERM